MNRSAETGRSSVQVSRAQTDTLQAISAARSSFCRISYWATVLGPSSTVTCSSGGVERADLRQLFESSSDFSIHGTVAPCSPTRPFRCDEECEKSFTQRSHLNQHIRVVHKRQRPFHCSKCDWAFGKRSDLKTHESAVHKKERPHVCELCSRAFAKRSNLFRHQEKLHADHPPNKYGRQTNASSSKVE